MLTGRKSALRPAIAADSSVKPGDFDQCPTVVIWEMTQARDLSCVHCRANARPKRTRWSETHLIDQLADIPVPRFGLTCGDSLKACSNPGRCDMPSGAGQRPQDQRPTTTL